MGASIPRESSLLSSGKVLNVEPADETKEIAPKNDTTAGTYDPTTYDHGLGRRPTLSYVEALRDENTSEVYDVTDSMEK